MLWKIGSRAAIIAISSGVVMILAKFISADWIGISACGVMIVSGIIFLITALLDVLLT